jgi:2-keto-myo-inositol isomerase
VQLGWNGASSMKADLETDIEIARRVGYPLLEIWGAKLRHYLQRHTVAELTDRLKESGVKPLSINSVERATFSGKDFDNVEKTCRDYASIAGEIGCEHIVVVPGKRPPGVTDSEVKEETVAVLEAFADIAANHDVKIAFEFLGFPWCSVRTLEKAWEIIVQVDRPDVGLVIDTFHFHVGGSQLGSLRRIDSEKLFILHVNDCEDRPVAQLQDAHRLLPGAGVLPLKKIADELKAIGYDRLASIELFRPEYWEREPFEMAAAAKIATEKAFGIVTK